MKDRIIQWLRDYLKPYSRTGKRKKLCVHELEEQLVREQFRDRVHYQAMNGYRHFVQAIRELQEAGRLAPVMKSPLNGRTPAVHSQWWLIPESGEAGWSDLQILTLSDQLDLSRYRQQPAWQTEKEWDRLQIIYSFMKRKDQHEWITREERAFQLFREEKFFTGEGAALLQRLQLTLHDLKAKVYGEPFVFWTSPGCGMQEIRTVLIVENLSFYHTCRSLMNRGLPIAHIRPDLLIYGEGKKVERSLSFLEQFSNPERLTLLYNGDMDPEGWGIYVRLKENYPQYAIQLAVPIYLAMAARQLSNATDQGQNTNELYLNKVLAELLQLEQRDLADTVRELWEQGRRIPQEVLSLDNLRSDDKY